MNFQHSPFINIFRKSLILVDPMSATGYNIFLACIAVLGWMQPAALIPCGIYVSPA